ncbi:MAG: twin transmembrane helix small protein [Inquilinus sp.]|nr:twin transmembrane helix small protein [Inquilinus sp.]
MSPIALILVVLAMLAVLATLFVGLIGMARGGEFNARYGNRLMRLRVILQGVALLLVIVAAAASA